MSELGISVKDWATWTDDVVVEWHRCPQQRNDEIGVLRREAGQAGPAGWVLAIVGPATEDDVKKGVAPELGVPGRMTSIEIAACPFCGAALAR